MSHEKTLPEFSEGFFSLLKTSDKENFHERGLSRESIMNSKSKIMVQKRLRVNFFTGLFILLITFALGANGNDNSGQQDELLGIIVFDTVALDLEPVEERQSIESVNLENDIYAMVYLKKALGEYYEDLNYEYDFELKKFDYNYSMDLYVDDQLMARWYNEIDPVEEFNTTTTFPFILATKSDEKMDFSSNVNDWVSVITDLEPGEHDIRMEVIPVNIETIDEEQPKPLAAGSFTIQVDEEKKLNYRENFTTSIPEPTMVNPEIEEMIEHASLNIFVDAQPVKAIITDNRGDFRYTKDERGAVLYRDIIATVVYKMREGDCWVKTALYNQPHQGSSEFGTMKYSKTMQGYYEHEVPCWKLAEDE